MLKKLFRQADARLEGEVALSSRLIYDLAEAVVLNLPVDEYQVRLGRAADDGQHFSIHRGPKVVSSFCVWSGKDLLDEHGRPTARRNVYVEWDDSVIDDIGEVGRNAEQAGTVSFFGKLLIKSVRGVPGSGAYEAFLQEYRRLLMEADSSANLTIVTG